jgi:DNA repair exonuclease SbcCD nuclease subunit/ABC-type cobalamin/Fe3+-siderophores transport system ATPase subunit
MRFAHISDTHIRNYKYQKEYREVFEKLYETLRKEKVDYIIHTGDIAHTKTQISPEFVELASEFLANLADIAGTFVLLGNHDGNLKNSARQDALTPIVQNLNHPNLHLFKGYGSFELENNFKLHALCVFDDENNWNLSPDPDFINIALYHGCVRGSETDIGWVLEGETNLETFQNFDYGFFGDIHKTNQMLDDHGRFRYPGSTIQQNFGESNDKGILIWDIKDKENFTCKHIQLENPKPFITINLTPTGRLPRATSIPTGARVRLISEHNHPISALKKAADVVKTKFRPESVAFLNKFSGARGASTSAHAERMNMRDADVQERLMKEYLADYELTNEQLSQVFALNKQVSTLINEDEETKRNIHWSLENFKFDNLFNYGENNSLDFAKLNGIVGIFGKNYSGKSSIIDSILYTIFNSSSKSVRKNVDLINQNKEEAEGEVKFSIGSKEFTIKRESKKYIKRLHGKESTEAKTDLTFSVYDPVTGETECLNGQTRNETDANIRRYLGTLDDFLLTSMMSQMNSLNFINEGTTKRKEILAKFLDLEILDKKFKKAKEISQDKRALVKSLEGTDYDAQIEAEEATLVELKDSILNVKLRCNELNGILDSVKEEKSSLQHQIDSQKEVDIDINSVLDGLKTNKDKKELLLASIQEDKVNLKSYEDFIQDFDLESILERKEVYSKTFKRLTDLTLSIKEQEREKASVEAKQELLSSVPCGDQFPTCRFIKDAHEAVGSYDVIDQAIKNLQEAVETYEDEIKALNVEEANKLFTQYNDLVQEKSNTEKRLENKEMELRIAEMKIKELTQKKKTYEENETKVKEVIGLKELVSELNRSIKATQKDCDACNNDLLHFLRLEAAAKARIDLANENKQKLEDAREEYSTYVYFMRCVHPNGIPYDVDFQVFFEEDGNKLNVFIKHPKFDQRPIELGSGAEKTIAATAIRLGLLNVSSLPIPNFAVLDEPATALDAENMDGFIKILQMYRENFETVFLISHLDSLKDIVDDEVTIQKKDGYAFVDV